MKTTQLVRFTLLFFALAVALPARGDRMSVPSKEAAAYTLDVPSTWKPTADKKDESIEATAPGNDAYLTAWVVKGSDREAVVKDMETTLKDALSSIDSQPSDDQTIEINATKIYVMKGSGVSKRAGKKMQFRVAIFDVGGGNVGIVYTDYDDDAPGSTMKEIHGIIGSIMVAQN